MAIQLLFLGKLADLAGTGERQIQAVGSLGWDDLLGQLEPALAAELACERVRAALNGALLTDKAALRAMDGDELAFLPPVSGG